MALKRINKVITSCCDTTFYDLKALERHCNG